LRHLIDDEKKGEKGKHDEARSGEGPRAHGCDESSI
jgi:hypothetical protein